MATPATSPFHIEVQTAGENATALLGGELDVAAAPRCEAGLEAAIESSDATVVVVDLSDLTFIDSRGMSSLLDVRRRLEARGRRMQVININPRVARFFEIAGLSELFDDEIGAAQSHPDPGAPAS